MALPQRFRVYLFVLLVHFVLIALASLPIFYSYQDNLMKIHHSIIVDFSEVKLEQDPKERSKLASPRKKSIKKSKKTSKAKTQSSKTKASKAKSSNATSKKINTVPEKKFIETKSTVRPPSKSNSEESELALNKSEIENAKKLEELKNDYLQKLNNAKSETIDYSFDTNTNEESSLEEWEIESGEIGSLEGRKLIFKPEIEDHSSFTGVVVVDICVNKQGKVISAEYTQNGSTTTDAYLVNIAKNNALLFLFSKSDAPKQCGKIRINFTMT